jgi:single-stranded-DNA-specific exonuclease
MPYKLLDVDGSSICRTYGVSTLVGRILAASSISSEQLEEILHPQDHLSTSQAPCIQAACRRILAARDAKTPVFIGGDYDADGICSTAIMKDTLDRLGVRCGFYIPDRFREGYGLHPETVELAAEKGYGLILTVDNGVKAHAAIAAAKARGIPIIISDHHEIEEPVEADLVVHPDYMESEFSTLSGAGVALELSRALLGDVPEHTALAALAAIGDVMPLYRQTRVIVRQGLALLNRGVLPAVTAMVRGGGPIDETAVGFQIVPKLNAVGRMSDASNVNTLPRFLLSKNPLEIERYAAQLDQVNDARKQLSARMVQKAEQMCTDDDFLLIYDEEFQEGLCGLAAGRLAAQHHRPVLVLCRSGDLIKGSGRSVPGFNLFAFFQQDFEMLSAFGGHEQAVGLSFPADRYEEFAGTVRRKMKTAGFAAEEEIPAAIRIRPEEITFDNVKDLELLSPYPRNLIKPLFALENPRILRYQPGARVTRYVLSAGSGTADAVLFPFRGLPACEAPHLLVGTLGINRFRDQVSCQLNIEGLETA